MPAQPVLPVHDSGEVTGPCCSTLTGGVVADELAEDLARRFKALSDPTRVKLISLIATSASGEACICDLTEPVGLSQPTVSHHMRLLGEAGMVTSEKRGRWVYYRMVPDALAALAGALITVPRTATVPSTVPSTAASTVPSTGLPD